MSRRECLEFARGFYAGAKHIDGEVRGWRCYIEVHGIVVGAGASWSAAYGDMRRRLDKREHERAVAAGSD